MCVSGGKKCLFFGNFGVLCFLETPVLRFALLLDHRRTWSRKCHLILLNQAILGFSLTEVEMTNYQAIYVRCIGACWCDIREVGKLAFITVAHMHSTVQHDVFTPCKKTRTQIRYSIT